jgi:hypothetical protein
MPVNLATGYKRTTAEPVDTIYLDTGLIPYTSATDANSKININLRYRGQFVNVNGQLYWYKDGITGDGSSAGDLVPFSAGATSSVNVVTGNTTAGNAADTNYIYLVNGAATITMPTAVGNKNSYTIKRIGTGTVSIATAGGQTIDGSTSPITINVQYVSITLVSDGANWFII